MPDAVHPTGDEIAARFEDWGPPLRPPVEAVRSYRRLLASWAAGRSGPTPMLRLVWPGDISGVRQGVVGDWVSYAPAQPPQTMLADGAPVFFAQSERLFGRGCQMPSADGIILVRTVCASPK